MKVTVLFYLMKGTDLYTVITFVQNRFNQFCPLSERCFYVIVQIFWKGGVAGIADKYPTLREMGIFHKFCNDILFKTENNCEHFSFRLTKPYDFSVLSRGRYFIANSTKNVAHFMHISKLWKNLSKSLTKIVNYVDQLWKVNSENEKNQKIIQLKKCKLPPSIEKCS